MLDRVGEVHVATADADVSERLIQKQAGWANERFASTVLLITGLFANDEQFGTAGTPTKDDLGRILVEVTPATLVSGGAQSP
jgi:hypothetical protein